MKKDRNAICSYSIILNMEANMKKVIRAIDKVFDLFENQLCGVGLLFFSLLMTYNVISRYCFGSALAWGEEVSRYINVWIVMLGTSAGVKYGTHVGVDAVVQFVIPKKAHKAVRLIGDVLSLVFAGLLIFYGYRICVKVKNMGQVSAALLIPIWLMYAAVPIGFILFFVRYIFKIIEEFTGPIIECQEV